MAVLNIQNIRAGLNAVIAQLVTDEKIVVVYDYYEPNPSGYPVIMFDITNNADSFLTDNENLVSITFTAYILVEVFTEGIDASKDILDDVTDSLLAELRSAGNLSLGGTVDWITPAIGPRDQIETPSGQAFSQQLDIVANVASSI